MPTGTIRTKKIYKRKKYFAAFFCFLFVLFLPKLAVKAKDSFVLLEDTGAVEVNPEGETEITGNITVKLPDDGVYLPYLFKIMDAEYDEDAETYKLSWKTKDGANEVSEWVYNFFTDNDSDYSFYADPQALGKESPVQQADVYEALLEWIKSTDYQNESGTGFVYTAFLNTGDDNISRVDNTETFSNMPLGQYLYWVPYSDSPPLTLTLLPVRDSDGTWRLSDVNATLKYGVIDVVKSVDQDQASMGDALTFTVEIAVPNYDRYTASAATAAAEAGEEYEETEAAEAAAEEAAMYTDEEENAEGNTEKYEETAWSDGEEALTEKILRLEEGLGSAFSYQKGTMRIKGRGNTDSGYKTLSEKYFQVTAAAEDAGEGDFAIDFDYQALHDDGYTNVIVTYEAELTEQAEVGTDNNKNSSVLLYLKNTEGDITEAMDSVTVWTYGIRLIKVDGDTLDTSTEQADENTQDTSGDSVEDETDPAESGLASAGKVTADTKCLAGASFRLYRRVGVYIDKDGSDASEYLADKEKYEKVDSAQYVLRDIPVYGPDGTTVEADELYLEYKDILVSTDELSGVQLNGLGPGVYLLEEVVAPTGYNLFSQGLRFEIEEAKLSENGGESNGKRLTSQSGFTDEDGAVHASGIYELVVPNYKGIDLPDTGGEGVMFYTVLGFLLMAAATALLIRQYEGHKGIPV